MLNTVPFNPFPPSSNQLGNGGSVSVSAEGVSFDGTTSSMEATNVQSAIDELVSNFTDGVDSVYNACVAKGSTPISHSLSDVVTAIGDIETAGTLNVLRTGIGAQSDLTINESFTAPDDGYIMATGYTYMNSMNLSVNSGSNLLTKNGYNFTDNVGYHAVNKNDTITFAGAGTGNCYDYMTILFTTGVIPTPPTRTKTTKK